MKSIKLKLITVFTLVILLITVLLGLVATNIVKNTLMDTALYDLEIMAQSEAKYMAAKLDAELRYVDALAQNSAIISESIPMGRKISYCEVEAQRSNYIYFAMADTKGNAQVLNSEKEKYDVSNRDYFLKSMNGELTLSDLLFSEENEPMLIYSAPVILNGRQTGVFYGRKDGLELSRMIGEVSYKETGYAYLINNEGTIVAHPDTGLVLAKENILEKAQTEPDYQALGAVTEQMIRREVGNGSYSWGGAGKLVGYAPIEGTAWILALTVENSEVLAQVNALINTLIALCVIVMVVAAVISFLVSVGIARPIQKVTQAAQQIADGNFNVELKVKSKDEVGRLAEAFGRTIDQLVNYQGYINDIADDLLRVAQGDLKIKPQREFAGEFQKLKLNMGAMLESLNATLQQINQAALQVDSGAQQVAHGAQALSQGASEQSSSIEELSAAITEVDDQVHQNAENANLAHQKAGAAGVQLQSSNEQMQNMVSAMGEITVKSSEISKIIKIIDDIAFQTNILALNAAVEAARAGSAGKGFAVVADEVRNLAGKSADAAKSTTELIEQTLAAVKNGTAVANATAQALEQSALQTQEAIALIDKIAQASREQADAIHQINQGVDQISAVVQTNAATAEESAAASEQLSAQSSLLKELISKFRLREETQSGQLAYDSVEEADDEEPVSSDAFAISLGEDKY
ncbi:MAG: methyl-accepting chemotaxis protein [Oscillospiraceae bacterium]